MLMVRRYKWHSQQRDHVAEDGIGCTAVEIVGADDYDALAARLADVVDTWMKDPTGPDIVRAVREARKFMATADSAPTGAGGNAKAFVCCEGVEQHAPGCTADSADVAPAVCNWRADAEGVWASDCGHEFSLEDDPLPSKHGMKFCHGCGKPLAEHPYVEPPVCGECGEELEDGKCPEGCTAVTVNGDSADPVIHAQHDETGRMWTGPRSQLPQRYFECVTDEAYAAQVATSTVAEGL